MRRVMLTVAYEGTNYCGWQVQPNGRTIEGELNRALSELLHEKIVVIGASRTDSGVHSRGNVAVFDTASGIPAEKFALALNQRLPEDIAVQSSREVPADFHPRRLSSRKTYEYRILNRAMPMPLMRRDTYFCHFPLDVDRMQKAAEYLKGEHDFKSFCSTASAVEMTVRTIYSLHIARLDDLITIGVTGSGFLYNMVRILAGTLIEVGTGKRDPESMREILLARDRAAAGPTAPAHGLTMIGIRFEQEKNLDTPGVVYYNT